jgi:23S rRNA (adenine2503-C2)-methyltransferase
MHSILDDAALQAFLEARGEKPFRLKQIHQALYKDLVESIDEMTTISAPLREELKKEFFFNSLEPSSVQKSLKDSTVKVAFRTRDGLYLESVLMSHLKGRKTVCVSSQVGCAMACTFCATGKLGLFRNLHFYEIVDQLLFFDRMLKKETERVDNLVFMGMGEPMLNYENVIKAIRIINDPKKLEKGARHLTISTCGIVPGIEKLIQEKIQVKLAISLHAPNDKLRNEIMPVNKGYPLEKLMDTLDKFTDLTNKRVMYEYVMLSDVNDKPVLAHELGQLLKGRLAHVNLIPWNPIGGDSTYKRSKLTDMKHFQEILSRYGVTATIRASLGDDIAAACGQLAKNSKTEGSKISTSDKFKGKAPLASSALRMEEGTLR